MALSPGTLLGPYEIVSPLGSGGVGEVYRALDPRIGREVAIKVLLSQVSEAAGETLLQRFEHEARAAGTLNHPNIVAVYDVGSQDGRPYVVSELLEGTTLRDKLAGGALPSRKAVEYAVQIAHALAAAHDKKIVHRDLKPENIFITKDGRIKVLDFGLAKLVPQPVRGSGATEATPVGTVLGTLGYMSPEQIRGRSVDPRSDLFSLGAVLYEMLYGRRAFRGETPADTMTAILSRDPPENLDALGPLGPTLQVTVNRCLEKDMRARFQSARDLAFALETLASASSAALTNLSNVRPRRGIWAAVLLLGALTAAVATGWGTTTRRVAGPATTLTRVTWEAGLAVNPAVSRDGKLLAYASDRAGDAGLDIWIQQTAGGDPLRLTRDSADDHEPSFSPDATKIAFRSEREGGGVYLVSALGGAYELLIPHGHWPRFSPDGGRLAYIVGTTSNVFSGAGTAAVVPVTGGEPRTIPSVINVLMPVWAPDGKHLLLVGHTTDSNSYDWWVVNPDEPAAPAIRAGALATFEEHGLTTLNPNLGNPDPFPKPFDWVDNRIIFSATQGHGTNLWEVEISPRTFQIVGAPRRLTEGTELESEPVLLAGRGGPSKLVFSALSSSIDLWQVPVDASQAKPRGEPVRVTEDPAREEMPTISANGRKLAFISNRLGNADVWVKDLDSGVESAVAVTPVEENLPVMSFDGSRVTYAPFPRRAAPPSIFSIPTSGGGPERVCEGCGAPTDLSQDGRWLLLQFHPDWTPAGQTPSHPRTTLGVLDRTSGRKVEILRHDRYNLFRGHLSPDGQWITFHGDRLGLETREFIARFRGSDAIPESEWIAVTDGAAYSDTPRWSPDGNVLYYLSQRDGFRCIWAQRLEPATKQPLGAPTSILHIHNVRRSISGVGLGSLDLAVSQNKIVFNMIELWSNIWTADLE